MTTILLEAQTYRRLADQLNAIDPTLNFVLMEADGQLYANGQPVSLAEAQPQVAWLNVGLMRTDLAPAYIQAVLEAGTIKWLQSMHAGRDQDFYRQMAEQGIRISGSNAQAIAIAEYVIGNVLACYQQVFERRRFQQAHQWQRTISREIWRTTWLLVGFGNIGQAIAQRVRAFEANVSAVRRSGQAHPLANTVITLDQLPEHLPQADVVVIACPLTAETAGLANSDFFQQLKPGATFVNIARGKIVDEAALLDALQQGRVAEAILDVFDPEPLPPDSPLWDVKNILISPHSSNSGCNTPLRGDLLFLENLRRFLNNEPLLNE